MHEHAVLSIYFYHVEASRWKIKIQSLNTQNEIHFTAQPSIVHKETTFDSLVLQKCHIFTNKSINREGVELVLWLCFGFLLNY